MQSLQKQTPILDELYQWLETESKRTLPKSKLGERGIKPFVLARKNFLFAKSPKGATAGGIAFSIIETAKANDLKPFHYLNYIFEKLSNIDLEDYDALDACLPWSKPLPNEIRRKTDTEEEK